MVVGHLLAPELLHLPDKPAGVEETFFTPELGNAISIARKKEVTP
jgi:hypothetical protein